MSVVPHPEPDPAPDLLAAAPTGGDGKDVEVGGVFVPGAGWIGLDPQEV